MNYQSHKNRRDFTRNHALTNNSDMPCLLPPSSLKKEHSRTLTVPELPYHSIKSNSKFSVPTTTWSPTFSGIISSQNDGARPVRNPSLVSLKKSARVLAKRLSQTNIFEKKPTSIITVGSAAATTAASDNKADFNFQFKRLKTKPVLRPEHFQICRVIIRNAQRGSSKQVSSYIPLRQSQKPRKAKSTSVQAHRTHTTSSDTKKTEFLFPKLFQSFMNHAPSNLIVHDLIVKVKKISKVFKISLQASLNHIERRSIQDQRVISFIKYQRTRKWFCKWIKAYLKSATSCSPYVSKPVLNVNTKTNQVMTMDSNRDQIILNKSTSPQTLSLVHTTDPFPHKTNLLSFESLTKSLSRLSSPRARKPWFDAIEKLKKLLGKMIKRRLMTKWAKETVIAKVMTMKHYAAMLEIKTWRGFKCYFNRIKQMKQFQLYSQTRAKRKCLNAIRLLYYSQMVVSFRQNQARTKYTLFLKRRALKRMFLFARFQKKRNKKFVQMPLVKAVNALVGGSLRTYLANCKRIKFVYKQRIRQTLLLEHRWVKSVVFKELKLNSQLLNKFKFSKVVGLLKKAVVFWLCWATKNKRARQLIHRKQIFNQMGVFGAWKNLCQKRQKIVMAADTAEGMVRRNLLKFYFGMIVERRSVLMKLRSAAQIYINTLCRRVLRSHAQYRLMIASKRQRLANLVLELKNSKTSRILNVLASYSKSRVQERSSKTQMGLRVRRNCLKRFLFVWRHQIRVNTQMLVVRKRQALAKLRQACWAIRAFQNLTDRANLMAKIWAKRKIVSFLSKLRQLNHWYKQEIENFKQANSECKRYKVFEQLRHSYLQNQKCRLAHEKIKRRQGTLLQKQILVELQANVVRKQKIRSFQAQWNQQKKSNYLHLLKQGCFKMTALRLSYTSVFSGKFRVICKNMLTNWRQVSRVRQDKRKQLNHLQCMYLKRKGIQKMVTYLQFRDKQRIVNDFSGKIWRQMVGKRTLYCIKRYLNLHEIKRTRVKEQEFRKKRQQLAFRSLKKVVCLNKKKDFIMNQVVRRVKQKMMAMWQSMMVRQLMVKNLLETKEVRQSCKVFKALMANTRNQKEKKANLTSAQNFRTKQLLQRSILSLQFSVQLRIQKLNLANFKEKLASKQHMLVIWCEWYRVCRKMRVQSAIGYHIKKRQELRTKKVYLNICMSAGSHQKKCRVITAKGLANIKKIAFNGWKCHVAKKKLLIQRLKIQEQRKGKHLARAVLTAFKSFVKSARKSVLAQQISKQYSQRRIMMQGYLQIVRFAEKSRRLRAVMRRVMLKRRLNQKRQWLRAMAKMSKPDKEFQSPPDTVRLLKVSKFDTINLRLLEAVEKQHQEKYSTVQPMQRVNCEKLQPENLIGKQAHSSGTRSDISNQENRIPQVGSRKPPKLKSVHKSQSPQKSCVLRKLSPMVLKSLQ